MVGARLAAWIGLASLCACELVVDDGDRSFAVVESGVKTAPDADVDARAEASTDASTDASTEAGCPSTCATQALSCQQACAATQSQCSAACHGNGPGQPCKDSCNQADTACTSECGVVCQKCQLKAGCGPSSACPG